MKRILCALAMGGLLAGAGVAAAQVRGNHGRSAQSAKAVASTHKGVELAKVDETSAAQPETACKPPLYLCACDIGGEIQSWCTTTSACLHVCR